MTQQPESTAGRLASATDDGRTSDVYLTPTVADVYLDRLRHNVDVFRSHCGGADVIAVIKADAYGHGASRVARTLADQGVGWFGVATVAEGVKLRRAGTEGRVLVFGAPLPGHLSAYPRYDLEVTVSSAAVAEAVIDAASGGDTYHVHVKVDTGMGRIGVPPPEAADVVASLARAPFVEVAGLWTHLATADEDDPSFAYEQLERFQDVLSHVGDAAEFVHVANSAAALRIPESLAYDRALARIGIGLYGYFDLDGLAERHDLRPVMRLSSRVTHVHSVQPGTTVSYGRTWKAERATRIATVGAGYADGYHRLLGNRSSVGIRGRRYPVVGTVCMDMFMVDVGPDSDIGVDDEVVLFGDGGPTASELARHASTIPYEILTGVSSRVPRIYGR